MIDIEGLRFIDLFIGGWKIVINYLNGNLIEHVFRSEKVVIWLNFPLSYGRCLLGFDGRMVMMMQFPIYSLEESEVQVANFPFR